MGCVTVQLKIKNCEEEEELEEDVGENSTLERDAVFFEWIDNEQRDFAIV